MNLVLACGACGAVYRCLDTDGDVDLLVGNRSEYWPDKYRCPSCDHPVVGQPEEALPRGLQNTTVRDLTPQELLAALGGFGLPEERDCSYERVVELLGRGVKCVRGRDVPNTGRCIIHQVELKDGTRLYLGASSHGAVVYRITEPHNYAKKVLDAASTG